MVSTALCRLINVVSVGERLMTTQRRLTNAHEDTNASVHQFFFGFDEGLGAPLRP